MAKHANSTTAPAAHEGRPRRPTARSRRRLLETALDRLLGAVEACLADLDALDGDPDLEDGHDREQVCEGEGDYDEREPCAKGPRPVYADGGHDQTKVVSGVFAGTTFYTEAGKCAL